jgi:hypothetical protein
MLLASLYTPRGARLEPLPDGFAFLFDDPTTRIEVHERIAPLRRARAIFDAALGVTTSVPIREYLTKEGEHAAMLGVASTSRHALLGVVYGDDSYRLVVGHTSDVARAGEIATCVRQLTLELPLGLGEDRRRRFRYTPPSGWRSLSRHGLITEWFAPRFPLDPTRITVFPSSPIREVPSRTFDRSMYEMQWGGFVPSSTLGPFPLAMTQLDAVQLQLGGAWHDGVRAEITIVVLHDNTRTYVMRLDHDGSRTDENRETLYALARSVRPIGRTEQSGSAARALLSYVAN